MAEAGAIDWQQLRSRCLNDDDFVREMLQVFREHAPATHRQLLQSISDGQTDKARKAAHTLKGSAANLAAEQLCTLAAAAEADAKRDDIAALRNALPAMNHEMTRVLAEIDRVLTVK